MADKQITIEDIDTFIEALRYSQTIVNTANAGADLSFDFLRTYDYYGTVDISIPGGTEIVAEEIEIDGYSADAFLQYSKTMMSDFFYEVGSIPAGSLSVLPMENSYENSLMTKSLMDEHSLSKDGIIRTEFLSYSPAVQFDISNDDNNTVFPIKIYDQLFAKSGTELDLTSQEWSVVVSIGSGEFRKAKDSSVLNVFHVDVGSTISSRNITFESQLETREELLKNMILEDGKISKDAEIPESFESITNIFTMNKLMDIDVKKFGDTVELHLEDTYTLSELESMVDDFFSTSASGTVYTGQDTFLTKEQAEYIAEYIFRKVTGIKKASVSL